jgi:toxin ParE1/3/4
VTRYLLSPRAQADLEDIWEYTAANWNSKQAELYIRQLELSIKAVSLNPRLGRPCDEIKAGYRKYPAGSHILFYRLTEAGISIIRILHGRMDFIEHI